MVVALSFSLLLGASPVGIGGAPRAAQLLGQVPPPPPMPMPAAPLTSNAELVQQEIDDLQASMPTLGLPIGLLVGGGVALVAAIALGELGLIAAILGSPVILVVAVVVAAVGVALLVTGGITLGARLKERKTISQRIRQLREQVVDAPALQPLPPIPPPPPLSGGPEAPLIVASF